MAARCAGERISPAYQIPLYANLIRYHVSLQINALDELEEAQEYKARHRKALEAEIAADRQQIAQQRAELAWEQEEWQTAVRKWDGAIKAVADDFRKGHEELLAWQRGVQALKASMESVIEHSFSLLPIYQQNQIKQNAIVMEREMRALGEKFRSLLG